VLIMTSNVGSRKGVESKAMGFDADEEASRNARQRSNVTDDLKRTFSPEFLNRIDETIHFNALSRSQMYEILDILLRDMNQRLANLGIEFEYSDAARDRLVDEGFDPAHGARPLRRAIQRLVEDPLSERLLRGQIRARQRLAIDVGKDGLDFRVVGMVGEEPSQPAKAPR
jgi:ATP-dependent Clp protease ATP-binding subunit ClpC